MFWQFFAIVSCKNEPKPEPEPKDESFTVTFNTGEGGSAVPAATVAKDAKVAEPEDPTKEGAIFYTWFTEEACQNKYDFDTPVTADLTLYAKWVKAPAPETQTINTVSPADIVKMTATTSSDGFQFQWIFAAQIKAGDVISFKYKSNREFKSYTVRKMTGDKATSGKLVSGADYTADEEDAAGWHTFTYTVTGSPAATDIGIGIRLETDGGNTAEGDTFYIKEITYTSGETTTNLSFADANTYYGAESTLSRYYIRLVATLGGAEGEGVDEGGHNYSYDKFSLYWTNPNVQVNPGDVFSITFKPLRNDELTKDNDFSYSIRDSKKWFSEKSSTDSYPQGWSTFSEPDADGWITATYVFPAADAATKEAITYPATFRVDFRDENLASPSEGREADILYIRNMTITSGGKTTNLILDAEKTASKYAQPTVEEYYASAAPAE